MSGSGSGSATPADSTESPTATKKPTNHDGGGGLKQSKSNMDPFGTMRASARAAEWVGSGGRARSVDSAQLDDDDVFLPSTNAEGPDAAVASSTMPKDDPFGTLRASTALRMAGGNNNLDYRGEQPCGENNNGGYENELAITNELLYLLEEFKTKSYTVKEMESLFDKWRKKAAIYDFPDKTKVKIDIKLLWSQFGFFSYQHRPANSRSSRRS